MFGDQFYMFDNDKFGAGRWASTTAADGGDHSELDHFHEAYSETPP